MKLGKAILLIVVLVAVFVAGAATGPAIRDQWARADAPDATVATPAADPAPAAPARSARRMARSKPSSSRANDVVAAEKAPDTIRTIPVAVWEPELRDRAKAVLSPGSRLEIAAADFDDTEQFLTVAHAARNTRVPFVVLKDGLLNRRQSLAETIREFKPELDAKAEVRKARSAAREDLDSVG
jgi:hypothetical protein